MPKDGTPPPPLAGISSIRPPPSSMLRESATSPRPPTWCAPRNAALSRSTSAACIVGSRTMHAALVDLDKAAFRGAHQVGGRGEVADSRSIDDGGGRIELIPASGGGGVPSFGIAGQFGGL